MQDEQIDENKEAVVNSGDEEDEGNVGINEQGDDGEWEDEKEDEDADEEGWDHCYTAFKPEVQTLSNLRDFHRTRAIENNQDPNMFAVIDGEYESQGKILMRVSPEAGSFCCKGNVTGEILRWFLLALYPGIKRRFRVMIFRDPLDLYSMRVMVEPGD